MYSSFLRIVVVLIHMRKSVSVKNANIWMLWQTAANLDDLFEKLL